MRAPVLTALLGIALFACMDAVMKGQSIALGALAALLWRSVYGLAGTAALFAGQRRRWPPRARIVLHVKRSLAAAASILLFFWGLARTPMAEAVALTFLAPLAAAFLAALLLGERLRPGAIGGSLLALAGVGVMLAAKEQAAETMPPDYRGAAAILIASLLYAYNLVLLRRSAQAADPVEITLFTNLVMLASFTAVALLAALAAKVPLPVGDDALAEVARDGLAWIRSLAFRWPVGAGWGWLALAAALQITSSMLLSRAYAHAEAQTLAVTEYSAFLWAALLGWIVYREPLALGTVAGAALIVAGCVLATRGKRAPAVQTEAAL
ncbi:DMT family transporter [Sphingomonas jatrophae]|uniref:S-adenosylmethionine uptake transporter n=1 Tax=Sphingomonas jatrophae TaxID=1166337 RepID=A0A1I6LRW7_9SPHN|nr:DMT family transporter [Sphingomonas jatrophae]SFS06149.1 S-adenosylmethionine uptake transporter [Sphingomonas jatrophae]